VEIPSHEQLQRLSDADLVALARERMPLGDAGREIAKRCVALVYERHRALVRTLCAAKAPLDLVDDLEGDVYERFVRAAYLQRTPVANPAGLLVVMAQRVIASHYGRRAPGTAPLDAAADVDVREDGYEQVAAAELAEQLLAVLTPKQRDVVWLRFGKDMTSAEIAERLDTTPGNVDVIFFRAMRRLREEVSQ
jgi:RNA polymerase sigma factor (sigma-70 family)